MMTHEPQYEMINIHSNLNEPIYNGIKKLHNTNFMTTMDVASNLNIAKNTSKYVALTVVLNYIVYKEKMMIRQTIPATRDSPSYKEWRFLADGEPWICEPYKMNKDQKASKAKKEVVQSTLDSHPANDIPQYIIDRIKDNAKKNGLTYEQQKTQDLIKLYENYVIETVLTDDERRDIDALVRHLGMTEEDAIAKVLSGRGPTDEPTKKHTNPGESVITDKMIEDYFRTVDGTRTTKQVIKAFESVDGVTSDVVRAKLRVYENRGFLKSTVKLVPNEKNLVRKTSFWTLTALGRQAIQEVA